MKVDFHCHTTASDGSLTPFEIIDLAVKHDITTLAITDHDTTKGYEQVIEYAKSEGVQLISGVEVSCSWQGRTIHIVGLDFDVTNGQLQSGLKQIRDLRFKRADMILEKIIHRTNVEVDNLAEKFWQYVGDSVVGRGHFAQFLTQEGVVKNSQKAFSKYLLQGKPAYVTIEWPDLGDVIRWITGAGGIAVLAHPTIYKVSSNKLNKLIEDFSSAGGQAIEVVNQPRPSGEITGMADRANRFNLYASLGSDFHRPEHTWRGLGWLAPLPEKVTPVWHLFKDPIVE